MRDGYKYQFKVLAYYKSGNTRYGAEKYAVASKYTLKQMSAPKASNGGTKAKISWSKVNGAHGYHVAQYVKKNGKYVKVKGYFTTSTSKLFTAAKGKTYYYKVRAYDKVNGERIFAPWSEMKAYKR